MKFLRFLWKVELEYIKNMIKTRLVVILQNPFLFHLQWKHRSPLSGTLTSLMTLYKPSIDVTRFYCVVIFGIIFCLHANDGCDIRRVCSLGDLRCVMREMNGN